MIPNKTKTGTEEEKSRIRTGHKVGYKQEPFKKRDFRDQWQRDDCRESRRRLWLREDFKSGVFWDAVLRLYPIESVYDSLPWPCVSIGSLPVPLSTWDTVDLNPYTRDSPVPNRKYNRGKRVRPKSWKTVRSFRNPSVENIFSYFLRETWTNLLGPLLTSPRTEQSSQIEKYLIRSVLESVSIVEGKSSE